MEPGSDTEDSQSDGEEGERERGRDPERMVEEGDGGVGIQGSPGRTQVNLGRMESFADTLYCPSEPIGSLDRHKIKEMEEKCMRHITGLAAQQGREVAVIYLRRDDGSNDIKVVSQSLRLRMTMGKAIESGSIDCAEEGQQKMLSQNRGKLPNEVLRDIIKHSCTQMRFSSTATVSDIYLSARDDPSMTTVFNSVEWDHIRKPISHKDVHDKRDQLLLRARIHFLRGDCPYTWEKTLLTVRTSLSRVQTPDRMLLTTLPSLYVITHATCRALLVDSRRRKETGAPLQMRKYARQRFSRRTLKVKPPMEAS